MTDALDARVRARFGAFDMDVRVRLPERGLTVVFGRSGSGKTTLLRCIAGLHRGIGGRVVVRGRVYEDDADGTFVPPHLRDIGYVFQDAALFPHLSVEENLRYARARVPKGRTGVAVADALEWLGLEPFASRSPSSLSGGERQRVAIARALVAAPSLLLMDEPLASLDVGSRAGILPRLERVHRSLDVPVLYVTHAIEEVVRLADRILWIESGRVRACAPAGELFGQLEFGATLGEEASTVLDATVASHDGSYHLTQVDSAWGPLLTHALDAPRGSDVRLRIRARDVSIALEPEAKSSILNVLPADVVAHTEASPGEVLVRLTPRGREGPALLACITKKSFVDLGLSEPRPVFARVKSVSVR